MTNLFHLKPQDLRGWRLFPLAQLRTEFPYLYAQEEEKYRGREHRLRDRIPELGDCTWEEVINLTPVAPNLIKNAHEDACASSWRRADTWLVIDPTKLDPALTVVMVWEGVHRRYLPYDPSRLCHYTEIPIRTLEYYERERLAGRRPLRFQYVPHILHRGIIDLSGVDTIETP